MKFKAKTNDILYLFTKNASGKFIVEGFFAYGIKFKGTRIYLFLHALFIPVLTKIIQLILL